MPRCPPELALKGLEAQERQITNPHPAIGFILLAFEWAQDDSLRSVVERLSLPGVRRLVVCHPETSRVEGIVSVGDIARYLML